jgi:hypothetical protein
MFEIPLDIKELIQSGHADDALARLRVSQGLEPLVVSYLEGLCHSLNGDFLAAESVFEGFESEDEATLLLQARIAFELGKYVEAEGFLELVSADNRDEVKWLAFCNSARRFLPDIGEETSAEGSKLRQLCKRLFSPDVDAGQSALKSQFGLLDPGLQSFVEMNEQLEILLETDLRPKRMAEELQVLVRRLDEWQPRGQVLRRHLLGLLGLQWLKAGKRDQAFEVVKTQLQLEGHGDIDDWLTWGDFLKKGGFAEIVVLEAFRRALQLSNEHSGDLVLEHAPRAALALADAYSYYGYTVEARSLLQEFYDQGLRDEGLRSALRRVMVREALGLEDIMLMGKERGAAELPEFFSENAEEIELNKEALSLLFIKAEFCFEKLGVENGREVLEAAKKLKTALIEKDHERARRYEKRLSRYVVRLYEEAV